MNIPQINPSGNFSYPFSQTPVPRNENPALSDITDRLSAAKAYLADAGKTKKVESKETKQTQTVKKPLTPEAAYNACRIFNITIMPPDGRFFRYRDRDDNDKEKIFDTKIQKDIALGDGRCLGILSDNLYFITLSTKNKIYLVDIKNIENKTLLIDLSKKDDFNGPYYVRENNALYLEEHIYNTQYPRCITKISLDKNSTKYLSAETIYHWDRNKYFLENLNYSPDGKSMTFTKKYKEDANGKREPDEIYAYDIENKKECQLSGTGFEIESIKYSPDGKYLAIFKNSDIYISDLSDKTNTLEYRITYSNYNNVDKKLIEWSPDSKYLIFKKGAVKCPGKNITGNTQYGLWLFDVKTKEPIMRPLIDGKTIDVTDIKLSKNGYLYFSAPDGFYRNIYRLNLNNLTFHDGKTSNPKPILSFSSEKGFISNWWPSDDGSKLYYQVDKREAVGTLQCRTMPSGNSTALGEPKTIKTSNFLADYSLPASKIDNFTYGIERIKNAEGKIIEHRTIYPLNDGKKITDKNIEKINIEYQITYPPGYDKNKAYPLIVRIHGGPNGRFDAGFDPTSKIYASQGYIVITPNIRGSEGYDQKYHSSIFVDENGEPRVPKGEFSIVNGYEDIMTVLDDVIAKNNIDKNKICLNGFSYGGSLVSYIACKPNKKYKFAALVAEEGQSQYALKALKENPNVSVPPLRIIQNKNDESIPFKEAEDFYKELTALHKNAQLIPYNHHNGNGHCFPENIDWYMTNWNNVIQFFNRNCQPDKEVYDSRTHNIYSYDTKEMKNIGNFRVFSSSGVGPVKEAEKDRKFAVIIFMANNRFIDPADGKFKAGLFALDLSKENFFLEDQNGKKYPLVLANTGNNFDYVKEENNKISLTTSKKLEFAFDVPKDEKEFILRIDGFPPIKITLEN